MKGQRIIRGLLVLGLAIGALGAPLAQSATRPDDRAGIHGVGGPAQKPPHPVRPDDRAGPLGVGFPTKHTISRKLKSHRVVVRPDDRPGIRGAGT